MVWLVRDGDVLASAEIANGPAARRKGLLGREHLDGAFVIRPCRQVHTLGMRVPLDVAFCDARGRVLRTCNLRSLAPVAAPCGRPRSWWRRRPARSSDGGCAAATGSKSAGERTAVPERARVSDHRAGADRAGALVLVGTPIGNLGDLAPRAVEALRDADVIAAEDTRRTRALLTHAEIPARGRVRSVHAHNEQESAASVVDAVRAGKRVAYVTDAGMPGISDPGARLVRACLDEGFAVRSGAGPERGAVGAGGLRLPDRALRVRGVPAATWSGTQGTAGVARHRDPHDGALRVAPAGRDDARGAPRGVRAAPGGGGRPRAHEAVRGRVARHAGRRRRPRRVGDGTRRARDRARARARAARKRATKSSTRTCAPRSPKGCRARDAAARVATRPRRAAAPRVRRRDPPAQTLSASGLERRGCGSGHERVQPRYSSRRIVRKRIW